MKRSPRPWLLRHEACHLKAVTTEINRTINPSYHFEWKKARKSLYLNFIHHNKASNDLKAVSFNVNQVGSGEKEPVCFHIRSEHCSVNLPLSQEKSSKRNSHWDSQKRRNPTSTVFLLIVDLIQQWLIFSMKKEALKIKKVALDWKTRCLLYPQNTN